MNSTDNYKDNLLSYINKGTSLIKGIGIRIGINILALISAAIITDRMPYWIHSLPSYSSFYSFIGIYTGIVCLLPRTRDNIPQWVVATCAGIAQCIFLIAIGFPWQLTLLWGGLQTWILRFILNKGSMGWEWSSVLWLLIASLTSFSSLNGKLPYSWLFATLPSVTCIALLAYYGYLKLVVSPCQRAKIHIYIDKLRQILSSNILPDPLAEQMQYLLKQATVSTQYLPMPNQASTILFTQLPRVLHQITLASPKALPPSLDSKKIQHNKDAYKANSPLFVRASSYSKIVIAAVDDVLETKGMKDFSFAEEEVFSLEARCLFFQNLSRELAKRKAQLPVHLHKHIDGLREATQSIIESMQKNDQDVNQRDRFLSRYLPASIKIIDNYIRFSQETLNNKDTSEIIAKLEEVLIRLETAFSHEYSNQLQNEALDIKADLATLDTLLRIKGF